jgi:hypothetical protein
MRDSSAATVRVAGAATAVEGRCIEQCIRTRRLIPILVGGLSLGPSLWSISWMRVPSPSGQGTLTKRSTQIGHVASAGCRGRDRGPAVRETRADGIGTRPFQSYPAADAMRWDYSFVGRTTTTHSHLPALRSALASAISSSVHIITCGWGRPERRWQLATRLVNPPGILP